MVPIGRSIGTELACPQIVCPKSGLRTNWSTGETTRHLHQPV